ncbi:MAG: hypothetical protein VB099_13190 [Candidatus Limiplasma sp.]|nr:hypothetical protein [Candidatus Limiplasma sp.]
MRIAKKPLGHAIWFKLILTLLIFVPAYSHVPYEPMDTTSVIASVLVHPLIVSVPWLLPVSKLLLLCVVIAPFILVEKSGRIVTGYYAFMLIVVGIFQNIAQTEAYGFAWLPGNTLIEFVALGFCIYDLAKDKTRIQRQDFNRGRCWIIPLMLLSYLMPYAVSDAGAVIPAFSPSVFYNEAGVTYCMITPVILGVMLLFSKGTHKPTLSIVSYIGFIFGLLNAVTWFSMLRESWWMGILHLPLLIVALYGLIVAHKERRIAYSK